MIEVGDVLKHRVVGYSVVARAGGSNTMLLVPIGPKSHFELITRTWCYHVNNEAPMLAIFEKCNIELV